MGGFNKKEIYTYFFLFLIFLFTAAIAVYKPTIEKVETYKLLFEYGQCKIYKFVDKNEEPIFFERCVFKEELKRIEFKKFERFETQDKKQMITIHMKKVK